MRRTDCSPTILIPSAHRKQAELARRIARLQTFEAVAHAWLKKQSWRQSRRQEPAAVGAACVSVARSLAIAGIKRPQVRDVLARIERTGYVETAYRILQLISSIFDYAVAEELCEHSPCHALSKTLAARPTRHHAAITDPKQVGELLRANGTRFGQRTTMRIICRRGGR